jgi:hypothetical protein
LLKCIILTDIHFLTSILDANTEERLLTHLKQSTLNRYLDGSLNDSARRKVWLHVQGCTRCDCRLQKEAHVRNNLRGELAALQVSGSRDLAGLLPGIMRESRQPVAQYRKRSAMLILAAVFIVTLLPFVRDAEHARVPGPLVNEPRITQTVNQDPAQRPTDESSSPFSREISLKYYASPVPPPQATAVASFEPSE